MDGEACAGGQRSWKPWHLRVRGSTPPPSSNQFCAGRMYAAHAREMQSLARFASVCS